MTAMTDRHGQVSSAGTCLAGRGIECFLRLVRTWVSEKLSHQKSSH
jgi:hypothetical protein